MHDKQKLCIMTAADIKAFQEYLFEREYSMATVRKYVTDMNTFFRFLQGNQEVDKARLLAYKCWLLERYSIASVNSMLAALNQMLVFCGAADLRLKRVKIQRQNFADNGKEMTKEEYRRLIDAALQNGKSQLALIIETICATGIRISELTYFTVEQLRRGNVKVRNKGKTRIILIPDKLRLKLLYYIQRREIQSGCIFVSRNGRPKDRSNIWSEMKALHTRANVSRQKIFPHNLRHLFARVYYGRTKDMSGLADILGHSSLETTRIYTASSGNIYQERIERLGLVT